MGTPALEVRGLVKRFRTWPGRPHVALDGIELVLAPGEACGLVGPNGSGKSTLLSIMAGVEPPTSGSVRVFGTPIAERAARRRVGFMPDGCPFPEELTPRAVLDLLGALHDVPWRTRRLEAEALLQRVGLGAEARLPLARFSLGMKRRFVLAQALLHRPDVLLLDEPTAGLDASGYLVLDRCLREARARGATLLIASHVVADLVSQCTRAVVLLGGRLVASGEARELLLAPEQLLALYERLAPPSADVPCSR